MFLFILAGCSHQKLTCHWFEYPAGSSWNRCGLADCNYLSSFLFMFYLIFNIVYDVIVWNIYMKIIHKRFTAISIEIIKLILVLRLKLYNLLIFKWNNEIILIFGKKSINNLIKMIKLVK